MSDRCRPAVRSAYFGGPLLITIGVGGSDPTAELQAMQSMRGDAHPISNTERETRIAKAQELMRQQGITALYLDASTSLY